MIGLIRLIESCDMEDAISLGEDGDLIEQCQEEVDDCMGSFFGEGGDEELVVVLLGEEGDGLLGGGGEDHVGDGEDLALGLLCLLWGKLEGLSLREDLSEEHRDC